MSVLRELAPAMQLRDRIAELEDANVALSARLQVCPGGAAARSHTHAD